MNSYPPLVLSYGELAINSLICQYSDLNYERTAMLKIAIIIPCYNEAITIEQVINDCKKYLPQATIYVIDNNSTDETINIALSNNVTVLHEYKQGKAYAVRKAFREIEADVYIMIDGDNTYPLNQIEKLIKPILEGRADMTVGDRHSLGHYQQENKRKFHGFGNGLIKKIINFLFGSKLNDILSGYRVFNRKFVKNYPLICEGFELEADMTIHALHYNYTVQEIPITFQDRPEGSASKLNTFSDGFKILRLILRLFKDNKPMAFFSILSAMIFSVSIATGIVVVHEFIKTHFITHVPLAILSASSAVLALLFFICGLILDTLVTQDLRRYSLFLLNNKNQD